jgi:hypothetical protein
VPLAVTAPRAQGNSTPNHTRRRPKTGRRDRRLIKRWSNRAAALTPYNNGCRARSQPHHRLDDVGGAELRAHAPADLQPDEQQEAIAVVLDPADIVASGRSHRAALVKLGI